MKKILFIIFALFLFSCNNLESRRMESLNSMRDPIVVFAKSSPDEEGKFTIVLIDKFGEKVIFDESDNIGPALIESYNLGDTLINLK